MQMAKKLYIGNLSYGINDASLADYFSKVGTVEGANVIMDKMTGRSRGFGFVTMTNDDEADKAISTLNGVEMDGRKLIVNEAKPLEPRADRGDRGFRGR